VVRELTGSAASEVAAETSLAATELSGQLRGLIGVQVSDTLLFEHPTTRATAAASAGGGLDGAHHSESHVAASGNHQRMVSVARYVALISA
jgi:hypothetical protein